jgi:aminoglycoside phosphotransferase (APT) family kinase protein
MAEQNDIAWLAHGLTAIARDKLGMREAVVSDLKPLGGHAGLGFSFTVSHAGGKQRFVVRTIEEGTPAKGPADVVRQGRIMQSMGEAGVPTPRIVLTGDADAGLGRPFFIGEFVEGYQPPDDPLQLTDRDLRLARRAMAALPLIHAADWRSRQDVFGDYQPLDEEFARLHKLYDRPTIDPKEGGRMLLLRDRLLETLPRDAEVGCVHGDFHWANIIFGEDEVKAIVDWEISFIGPTLLDVGWIAFYADEKAFVGQSVERARRFGLTPDEMIECYEAARGARLPAGQINWFRAFSSYRFGIITLFNCMLHRRGKRHDPSWELTIASAPQMVERGLELLA